ncbi:MAG: class I SAM-dependent methyltransferase [Candidatus Accumulibacter sp.]|jgi:hypothetical protein|nr:class I SAM-dependent methyltransferase [Accumulibacter sp.]
MRKPESENGDIAPETNAFFRFLAPQLAAVIIAASSIWPYYGLRNEHAPWPEAAFAIGGIAFLIASFAREAWWRRAIHTLFVPLLWKIHTLAVAPGWFLLVFVVLLVFYRGSPGGRIPLYFSNRATAALVAEIVGNTPSTRFIDLGAGIGSLIRPIARSLPDARVSGIENAPAVWLLGFIRTRGIPNCAWLWGDFWKTPLSDYDVVYAFLSPAPMAPLWEKLRAEMRPGSLLISNSFAVPGLSPDEVVEIGDARETQLYLYRLRETADRPGPNPVSTKNPAPDLERLQ